MISVLLVDDHVLVREGVKEILSVEEDIVVVSEAADSEEAIKAVLEHRPDIVLLDVEIPGRHAADTVATMRTLSPGTRIIVLSMYDGPQLLKRLIAEGIRGYLLKSVDRQELVSAIRSVCLTPDRMVLSISRKSMAQLQGAPESTLSAKEADILKLAAQALSNSQIATRMNITEATVKRHLHSVFVKLDAVSRIDAVNRGIAAGLITAPRDESSTRRPRRPDSTAARKGVS
jgi:DNA-binding NarL/FixJ family response regulator